MIKSFQNAIDRWTGLTVDSLPISSMAIYPIKLAVLNGLQATNSSKAKFNIMVNNKGIL